ncbi:biotin synthase BioB, partial [Williamsia sp. M5A3_1d]
MTQAPVRQAVPQTPSGAAPAAAGGSADILEVARAQVLEGGEALRQDQVLEVLRLGDDRL